MFFSSKGVWLAGDLFVTGAQPGKEFASEHKPKHCFLHQESLVMKKNILAELNSMHGSGADFILCCKFLISSGAGEKRLGCRPPFDKQPAGHHFSMHIWLVSFSSREESGHVLWKDLPGRRVGGVRIEGNEEAQQELITGNYTCYSALVSPPSI